MKILFICKNRGTNYGYAGSVGLINSAKFVAEYLNSIGIESTLEVADDANAIDKLVVEHNPKLVVLEALWVTPEKIKELLSLHRHKHRNWIVRIHSRLPFLANEGIAMDWLTRYREIQYHHDNFFVAPNDLSTCQDLKVTLDLACKYLPNIYKPRAYDLPPKERHHKHHIDIGCFGAIRPLKNQLIQAVAAARFAIAVKKRLRFHMNTDRLEQGGQRVLENIQSFLKGAGQELVFHSWMDHENFVRVLQTMDLNLQVSLSESFNIVSADSLAAGVPVVVSPEISWMPKQFMADPNSSDAIVDKLLSINGMRDEAAALSFESLIEYNKAAEHTWCHVLRSLSLID